MKQVSFTGPRIITEGIMQIISVLNNHRKLSAGFSLFISTVLSVPCSVVHYFFGAVLPCTILMDHLLFKLMTEVKLRAGYRKRHA